MEIHQHETMTVVLLAFYLASTTPMITVSTVEFFRLQRTCRSKVELKYVNECRKFPYYYWLCIRVTRIVVYST